MAYTEEEKQYIQKLKSSGISKEQAMIKFAEFQRNKPIKEQGMLSKIYNAPSEMGGALYGGVLQGAAKLVGSASKLGSTFLGEASRLAPGDQSADPTSFYNRNKVLTQQTNEAFNAGVDKAGSYLTRGDTEKYKGLTWVGEQAAPLLAGGLAGKVVGGAAKGIGLAPEAGTVIGAGGAQIPKVSKLAAYVGESSPQLAKYVNTAGKVLGGSSQLLAANAGYTMAEKGEMPSAISNLFALGIPVAAKGLGAGAKWGLQKLAKTQTAQKVMENLTLSNFADKTGLRNILAKVAKNGGDIVEEGEDALNELALQGHTALGGEAGALGDDLMSGVVKKIQKNIKPGTRANQIAQMNKVGDDLGKTVVDDLATIPNAAPSPPAVRILQTIDEKGMKVNKPVNLDKFKDVNGNWKEVYTPSELDEIKKLSDGTFKNMYSNDGASKEAYLGMANDRNAIKTQIEETAKQFGIPDIASRNAEIALFKGLAESARNASIGNRLLSVFKRNPWVSTLGSIGGVGGLIGGSYLGSRQTGIPQWVTAPLVFTLAAVATRKFGSNEFSTKWASKIYKEIGDKGASTLEKYLKTGKSIYRAEAQRAADKITNSMLKLSPPSGKPLTGFPEDFSPKVEQQYAAANRGASIANAGAYQGKPNTSTKIPKLADEFAKFIKTSAERGGREISKYEKKLLSIIKGKVTGTDTEKNRLIEKATKEAKRMLDFFEKNNLYNRYEQ